MDSETAAFARWLFVALAIRGTGLTVRYLEQSLDRPPSYESLYASRATDAQSVALPVEPSSSFYRATVAHERHNTEEIALQPGYAIVEHVEDIVYDNYGNCVLEHVELAPTLIPLRRHFLPVMRFRPLSQTISEALAQRSIWWM